MHFLHLSFLSFAGYSFSVAGLPHQGSVPGNSTSSSFGGVNSYFLHAFQESDRIEVLDAIQDAGLRTLRLFISYTPADNKATGSVLMPDIEPESVGDYDDTQLEAIDQLMVEAHERDIKLVIALHDRYQLGCWGNDTYVEKYNLPAIDCAAIPASNNDVTTWYTGEGPINDFENRIEHVLEHENSLLPGSPSWKDLSDYIFSFNIQNEGQGHLNENVAPAPQWWCDRSKFMREIMGGSKVLISTGGGNEFSNSDVPENWECETLDLVDIHSYSEPADFEKAIPTALDNALRADKLMIFEEFGAVGESKAKEISQKIDIINGLKVPWMAWQISKPGNGAADFEFWVDEPTYLAVQGGAQDASQIEAEQDFSQVY
ncbi:hypothetical protein FQN54_000726 [Arachnomyces sp. PD_36]|nr:hypothetical protein FQN54_000726 [Arachnomyces sp. PD_36]